MNGLTNLANIPQNMPIRDHNRADTDLASAPFWLSSGMSAKYIRLRFPNKKKLMDSTFYNEKKLTVRVHQLLLRRNSDWIKFTNAQLKREPEFSQWLFKTWLRSLSGGSSTFQRYRSTKRLSKIYKKWTVTPNWQYHHTANHKLICEDNTKWLRVSVWWLLRRLWLYRIAHSVFLNIIMALTTF